MIKFTSEQISRFVSRSDFDEKIIINKDELWPRISIVTPSFNQGQFLERTICSVLNQNYPNLEYIVMDGGSTDGTVEIIKKYQRYLGYWASEKDSGQADAIKKGFRKCTGKLLAWLNSDDIYLPGTLHRIADNWNKINADVIYANEYLINENDEIIGERRLTPFIPCISALGFVYGGFGIYQPSAFWTKELYYKVGEIDTAFIHCMDNELFARFALAKARFKFVKEFSSGFRVHPASKSSVLRHVAKKELGLITDKYRASESRLFAFSCTSLSRLIRMAFHFFQGEGVFILRNKYFNRSSKN